MLSARRWRRSIRRRPGCAAAGPMARTRRLAGQPALAVLALGGLALVALTQTTGLANRVVEARRQLDALAKERAFLEATIGNLEAEWNRVAARDAVENLAARELGLIAPATPGALVIVASAAGSGPAPAWARVLDAVGGGGAAVTAAAAEEARRP